jgi:hypothetical protein
MMGRHFGTSAACAWCDPCAWLRLQVRHCALSLVGEPIMYPYINEFVRLLHDRSISSFLVTNAQVGRREVSLSLLSSCRRRCGCHAYGP